MKFHLFAGSFMLWRCGGVIEAEYFGVERMRKCPRAINSPRAPIINF